MFQPLVKLGVGRWVGGGNPPPPPPPESQNHPRKRPLRLGLQGAEKKKKNKK